MNKLPRLLIRSGTVAVMLAVVISGWSNVRARTTAGKVTLTYWNGYTGPNRPAMEALVKKFNASHPNTQIQMTITPWDSLLQKLPSALASGSGPDLMGIDFTYLPQYAQSGYIKNLSAFYSSGALSSSIFPRGLVKVLRYHGKFYGAPIDFNPLMMYYNKDLFRKAGLNPNKPPTTWSQWIVDIKKLTKHGAGQDQYGIALGVHDTIPNWPILMWGAGGDVIMNGKPSLDNSKSDRQ